MSVATAEAMRVLVIDDEPAHAEVVAESLRRVGHDCTIASGGAAGAKKIDKGEFDLILTDLRMGDVDGLAIVRKAKQEQPDAEVVVITGYGDVKTAVEAIKEGAGHYLLKPLDLAELRAIVAQSAERVRLARANRDLRRQLDEKFGFEGVVGESPLMHKVVGQLRNLAPTRATVLILGENGTGKELAAKALHTNSPRKHKPFVAMNCAALNENLLDDEMFGHEKGAFTGADQARKGRFEFANGGTLFLDEIGDMPLSLQAKLLRVLENGEVCRVGSNEPITVDVRLLAATNRHLEQMIAEGKFRQDLYYRLKVGTVRLPALREHREDIPVLANHFLKELVARHGKPAGGFAEPVWRAFAAYGWPGNVRELRNTIEAMLVQDQNATLGLDDLPDDSGLKSANRMGGGGADALVGRPLAEVERYYMERAVELTEGNRVDAAQMLGIGERTLYRAMQDWKLQDQIRQALNDANGDHVRAAAALGLKPEALARKLKKLGGSDGEGD